MARSEGEPLVGEDILLHLAEVRFVNTKSLIPEKERNRHSWGGMSFSYFGGFMESWSQLTLHGIDGGQRQRLVHGAQPRFPTPTVTKNGE
jgi:hypothetical protein